MSDTPYPPGPPEPPEPPDPTQPIEMIVPVRDQEPTGEERTGLSGGAKAAIAVACVAALLLVGGGAYALLSSRNSGQPQPVASPSGQAGIETVPVNSASNPFTPPVAKDAKDVPPVETSQPTEVPADSVGLYGGSKQINVCDKVQLINFLELNSDLGHGWTDTIGIDYSDLRRYITRTTPAILRSDTFVTNHGWENGHVTAIRSVLQAGTAVLLDEYGVPVTRCYCGNPLTPPPSSGYEPTYYGPTWHWWSPTSITVIQQSVTIIKQYTFVNVYRPSETYTVAAGSDDPVPPQAQPPSPSATQAIPTPEPKQLPTQEPTPQPTQQRYTAQDAIDYWHRARARCSDSVFTFEDFGDNYKEFAEPTDTPGVYMYTIQGYPPSGNTLTFTWLVNLNSGALVPQNSLARQGAQQCGALSIPGN